jgi:hypothetical protein
MPARGVGRGADGGPGRAGGCPAVGARPGPAGGAGRHSPPPGRRSVAQERRRGPRGRLGPQVGSCSRGVRGSRGAGSYANSTSLLYKRFEPVNGYHGGSRAVQFHRRRCLRRPGCPVRRGRCSAVLHIGTAWAARCGSSTSLDSRAAGAPLGAIHTARRSEHRPQTRRRQGGVALAVASPKPPHGRGGGPRPQSRCRWRPYARRCLVGRPEACGGWRWPTPCTTGPAWLDDGGACPLPTVVELVYDEPSSFNEPAPGPAVAEPVERCLRRLGSVHALSRARSISTFSQSGGSK